MQMHGRRAHFPRRLLALLGAARALGGSVMPGSRDQCAQRWRLPFGPISVLAAFSRLGSGSSRMSYGWRLGAPLLVCCLWLSAPSIAQASTKLFSYTGSEQTVTVPAGVTSIHVVAIGAPGGSSRSGSGGLGAQASTDLSVTPGET